MVNSVWLLEIQNFGFKTKKPKNKKKIGKSEAFSIRNRERRLEGQQKKKKVFFLKKVRRRKNFQIHLAESNLIFHHVGDFIGHLNGLEIKGKFFF